MNDISSFYAKKAEKLKKDKKFEEALKLTNKATQIKQEEESENFWYSRAVHCCELGEYEDAVNCLDKDLSVHKKSYETFFLKGLLLMQLTHHAEAIECFNKAAEERNQNYLQSNKKAERLKKAHKFEKALLYADLAINEKQLDNEFWYNKGLCFFHLKKYVESNDCFAHALDVKNDDFKTLYAQAKCELFLENESKCLEILENICKHDLVCKEKLRVDHDFARLSKNKGFRMILGL
ncbi:hypothetical protein NKOR_05850 [Candidatus Nitrosopumilus koreensis AR1]|uniref:Uncharacterized protein n=1 Tax=Candidatus Nitrosopumilus koreensis AR1 TaxID=1229908 RepID=K0B4G4_9ARCH|nr:MULTISPECIES: hypothetical protein [Nitrosopumilus]AFS81053.1 hypothetical protein NKOR_05850 [Candidatus Nitrosopumilus koreensis AR1]